jgi:hypothetical protein
MYLNRKVQFVPFAEESSSPLQPLRYSFTDIFMNINLKKFTMQRTCLYLMIPFFGCHLKNKLDELLRERISRQKLSS